MVLARRGLTMHLAGWSLISLLAACATDGVKKQPAEKEEANESAAGDSGGNAAEEETDFSVSSTFSTLVFSNSNNPMTLHSVDKDKAQDIVKDLNDSLKKPTFKDRKELIALLSVKAVAGFGVDNMLDTAQQLVNLEMSKDVRRDLPEVAKLQIILASIRTRNLAMAEHFIAVLSDSKNKKVRAFLSLAEGFIAYMEDRVPEAVFFWTEALKHQGDYAPAKLNLAFVALKYGDHATAKRLLDDMEDDTFAATGLLIAERVAGDDDRVASLCGRLAPKAYKPAMFSCALHKYEHDKKYDEAIRMLQEVVKAKPSSPALDEKAYKLISKIEDEQRKAKERDAEERAKKAIEKADKERGAAAQGGAATQGAAPAEGGNTTPQNPPNQ